ncbi:MAG TPA: DNA mismatch repair endonuclease MutL [Ktedonobacteraceae bacterium]|nr:DNA mismatch repair endonuclease MutL [Ktedonobacteraceae bacterium]
MPIRQLAPDVAAKIAAGEVVERPASVVKELIENSIDAGATQIRVDLTNGGLQLIRVTDNGGGIPVDELPLALSRHATSKVAEIDDLEHIRTLGFRGEALASIAAVAEVTLLSRARGKEQGASVSAVNGQISEAQVAASAEGTTLTVRNLFSAVPARLKFLKSRNTEISHSLHMLEQYALAYPEIRFSVYSEGRQMFATPGDGQLSSVLIEIYGLQVAEQMIPISSLDGKNDDDPDRPVVSGYTSLPACYKSTRQHISFFVNRRWVMSRVLTTAVEEAYHSLLLTGRHPIAVVNITLDPAQLDVNVHPAKTEIRFLKERRVYAAVLRAVRNALLAQAEIPRWSRDTRDTQQTSKPTTTTATASESATEPEPDELEIDLELEETGDETAMEQFTAPGEPATPTKRQPFPQDNPWLTVTEEETGTKPPLLSRLWQSHVRGTEPAPTQPSEPATQPVGARLIAPAEPATGTLAPTNSTHAGVMFPETPANAPHVPEEPMVPREGSKLPPLRVVGQLSQSYIVTEGSDGMYLIDQHAAHERILLERMVAALKARTPISQMLLTPIKLELSPIEVEAMEEHLAGLEQIGFALELLDEGAVQVSAVPNVLLKQINARSLHDLLAEMIAPENQGSAGNSGQTGQTGHTGHTGTWEEHALANVACKAAIKANYFLTVSEMREMIEQLEQTSAPYSCCHGRPTMVHFSLSALEREFGRR